MDENSHQTIGDLRQEQVRQRERTEMVGGELQFEAVSRRPSGTAMIPALLIKTSTGCCHSLGECVHRREVGEVQVPDLHVATHLRRRAPAAVFVPYCQNHPSALGR